MRFVTVARLEEVPPGKSKPIRIDGQAIALFNVNGTYHAIDDCCPHKGAPLWNGPVAGTEVVCPYHFARFDLVTGAALTPPTKHGVRVYRVQVVGDEVQVEMA